MKRGCIHWARLDKRRPVIVLSPDRRNDLAHDLIVVPCTTRSRPMIWHVRMPRGEGGIPQASYAKCEQILTIPKADLESQALGLPLPAARMHEIERAILSAIGVLLP